MYFSLIFIALISVVYGGAIMSRAENAQQQSVVSSPQRQSNSPGSLQPDNQAAAYPTNQGNHASSSQLYYPTYPEYTSSGYSNQPSYDGYSQAAGPPAQRNPGWSSGVVSTLIPLAGYLVSYGARAGVYLFQVALLLALGAALTTLVCTFTPFCTISFLGFGLNKAQVREQVAELARTYITPESVNAATVLVSQAIEKYTALQREKREREEARHIPDVSK